MKVAMLHGYSASNAGDGLLVEESIGLVQEAVGTDATFVLAASDPESFASLGIPTVKSKPGRRGYAPEYLRLLRTLNDYDLVVGVGGGYLRAGHLEEAVKTGLVHGPQLMAAARTSTPVVYLPQSVGPARAFARRLCGMGISRIDRFFVRDDRTLSEFREFGVRRTSDLAVLRGLPMLPGNEPLPRPVVSVRALRGAVPPLVLQLARDIGDFDGYVQSAIAGNDDREYMQELGAVRILSREEFLNGGRRPRVVVAVRLHAALMALMAGHFVIHLAYERKGFGAFADLGLEEYVHNVNMFEPQRVLQQVEDLTTLSVERATYRSKQRIASDIAFTRRMELVTEIRELLHMSRRQTVSE
ncbi:polysaccharide pyruvyl transferase family protein [Rhodococcus sp. NPDC003318]|uniref:polysaccharide pyruvyl transferase family protein n=1 Tax=Rhodococcus sp. NPDC003318 TaxID=3364503 RepID=UPI0036AEA6C6